MTSVISYKTPQEFLHATELFLEQRELENNLILGLCNGFADKDRAYDQCVFINAIADEHIMATSINVSTKAIVSSVSENLEFVQMLAEFYKEQTIDLKGVVGESFYANAFAGYYGKPIISQRTMIVHRLDWVNNLPLPPGVFSFAEIKDAPLLSAWSKSFETDAKSFPKKSEAQIRANTERLIHSGHLFKWTDGEEIVSMAAMVRTTKTFGVIGLVYTPDSRRGHGYATACVSKLSQHILGSGFRSCALFTDKANPTSNSIYKKIGYEPSTTFTDLEFD